MGLRPSDLSRVRLRPLEESPLEESPLEESPLPLPSPFWGTGGAALGGSLMPQGLVLEEEAPAVKPQFQVPSSFHPASSVPQAPVSHSSLVYSSFDLLSLVEERARLEEPRGFCGGPRDPYSFQIDSHLQMRVSVSFLERKSLTRPMRLVSEYGREGGGVDSGEPFGWKRTSLFWVR